MEIDDGDKEAKNRKKYSHVFFKPFSQFKTPKDWHYKLNQGENVENLVIGSDWCAILTDHNYMRVFSIEGIQRYMFSLATPVVCMAAYENNLAIIYHSGPSIYGFQALKMKVIDMSHKSYAPLLDAECPISHESNISWCGYSDEGQLFTFDTNGILRSFQPFNLQWVPVLDFKIKCPNTFESLWIVNVSEQSVQAIELLKNMQAPLMSQKSMVRTFPFKMPFLEQERKDVDAKELTIPQREEEIIRLQANIEFETYRKDQWEHLKHFRTKFDQCYDLSESILSAKDINKLKLEVDKKIIDLIRFTLVQKGSGPDDHDRVLSYLEMVNLTVSYNTCLTLLIHLQQNQLAEKVRKVISDREQREVIMESFN